MPPPARRYSTTHWRGSTASSHTLDLGTHTLFVGEIVDAGLNDEETRAAAISDTRMKYGGVKRH